MNEINLRKNNRDGSCQRKRLNLNKEKKVLKPNHGTSKYEKLKIMNNNHEKSTAPKNSIQ